VRSWQLLALALSAALLAALVPASARAEGCANERFRTGAGELLPDCRAYERVSPADKGGLDAVTPQPLEPAQSSACEPSEECTIAYMNVDGAFAGAPANEVANAYRAGREAGGWATTPLGPPTPQAPPDSQPTVSYAFSPTLEDVVVRVPLQQLAEGAPAGVYNLYLRGAGGGYTLLTAEPPLALPEAGCGRCFVSEDVPMFAGASSGFARIMFETNAATAQAPSEAGQLYEAGPEGVRLVGILPDGQVPAGGAQAGGGVEVLDEHTGELEHAVSEDGARVVFEAASDGGPAAEGGPAEPAQEGWTELYDRLDGARTIELSAPAPGARPQACETEEGFCDPGAAKFWDASADGSLVYFTSKAALTKRSFTGPEEALEQRKLADERAEEEDEPPVEDAGEDLYRYDVETGALTDLTVDAGDPEDPDGADVQGVVGASEDGSYVYFVADGDLAAGATSGEPNLYVWHEGGDGAATTTFIATLRAPNTPEEEEPDEEQNIEREHHGPGFPYRSDLADWTDRPVESQAYVTPDGRHLAFMSVQPLSGYDNRDRLTGERDHEVFEYSAEGGELECASCEASGERPLGSAFLGAELDERVSTAFHQPRSLSDDGSRLFFSSPDPLVPGVYGGTNKLYEYEHGAAHLISGPQAGGEATFLDASASGNDVFFATREQLVASDVDESIDVYDARVGGGLPSPAPTSPCQGGCQEEPASAPTLPAPLSATFVGPGDATPAAERRPTRRQLLARALARCRSIRKAKRRTACVAAARRRYGPHKPRAHRRPTKRKRAARAR